METNNARLLENVKEFEELLKSSSTGKIWEESNLDARYQKLREILLDEPNFHTYLPAFLWDCREFRDFRQHIKIFQHYSERRTYLSKEFAPLLEYLERENSAHTYSSVLKQKLIDWLKAGGDGDIAKELEQCKLHAFKNGEVSPEPDGTYTAISVRIHAVRITYEKLADVDSLFRKKVEKALQACISGKSYFGGITLEALVANSPLNAKLFEDIPNSSESIKKNWDKLLQRQQTDPAGAITTARTLVEDVCKFILDELGESYDSKDDLPELYKKIARLLSLAPENHKEEEYKKILGGMSSIVTGLASLRNALGDSHGKGKNAPQPAPRHAQLAVNISAAAGLFLIETYQHWKEENVK